jgi:dihydroorotase
MARATGCRFHVVHLSSERGVEVVRSAQEAGIPISAETCPQYLTLTADDFGRIGTAMKIYPPVRHAADRDALWEAIHDGTIASIGSDHAPHTVEQKRLGPAAAPAGAIGVETVVPLMLNEMARGRLSAEELAWLLSEGTARLYRLYPQKGAIQPGSDADFTLVDPAVEWTIDNARLHSKHPFSPWHGFRVRGAPVATILRGRVIMRDGNPVGEPMGALVRPARPMPAATPAAYRPGSP